MSDTGQGRLFGALVALVALVFAAACAAFVRQPTLASFADDSVSYLVMAQVFSPYQPATPAVAAAFAREAFYPPLFPLVLALSGAAHDLSRAHAVPALLLALALPLTYLLGVRWLGSRGAALTAVACLALLPSMWVNAKGILSEPLFCLLLAATFVALEAEKSGRRTVWVLAALMAGMALTRTAALPMIAVYGIWSLSRAPADLGGRVRAAAPALAAFAAYGAWILLRPAHAEDDYARILIERGRMFLDAPGGLLAFAASLARQAQALVEGWAGSLLLFWVDGRPLRFALAGLLGVLALAGIALRIWSGKADGWMTGSYLATLLAWPFYDQMERFLFPALPVLILYVFVAAGEAMRALSRRRALAHALVAGLILVLAVPAMAFVRQRAQFADRATLITDWYRTPDLERARRRSQVHLDLLDDMQAIGRLTQPGDRIMWVAPSYLALLADRRGVASVDARLDPEAYRAAVRASGVEYVFLSRYHPRDTIRDTDWQAGVRALAGEAKAVHTRTQDGGSIVSSILLKVAR